MSAGQNVLWCRYFKQTWWKVRCHLAHCCQKLQIDSGRISAKDLQTILNVNISQTYGEYNFLTIIFTVNLLNSSLFYIMDIKRHVGVWEPQSRFSLYLSTKLAHGAIQVHYFQVKHYLSKCSFLSRRQWNVNRTMTFWLFICSTFENMLNREAKEAEKRHQPNTASSNCSKQDLRLLICRFIIPTNF